MALAERGRYRNRGRPDCAAADPAQTLHNRGQGFGDKHFGRGAAIAEHERYPVTDAMQNTRKADTEWRYASMRIKQHRRPAVARKHCRSAGFGIADSDLQSAE